MRLLPLPSSDVVEAALPFVLLIFFDADDCCVLSPPLDFLLFVFLVDLVVDGFSCGGDFSFTVVGFVVLVATTGVDDGNGDDLATTRSF